MKEKQGNVKLKMLKIIFNTTCKNTKDDKYGEIRRYITENKIGLDEAIDALKVMFSFQQMNLKRLFLDMLN